MTGPEKALCELKRLEREQKKISKKILDSYGKVKWRLWQEKRRNRPYIEALQFLRKELKAGRGYEDYGGRILRDYQNTLLKTSLEDEFFERVS